MATEIDNYEDDYPEIEAKLLGSASKVVVEHPDAFNEPISDIKKMVGLTPGFRRKLTNLEKSYTGLDDAHSKKIEYQAMTGYNAFKVISPPYNLDYLAKLFEISSPHASAVRAKAANIVGLGYDFIPTQATKEREDRLRDKTDALDRFRRRLQRIKSELTDWLDNCNDEDTFTETLIKVWIDYETTGNGYIEIGRTKTGMIGYIGHAPSTTMRIRRDRDGFVQIISNKAVFFRNFGDTDTPNPIGGDTHPNEILHIKKYSPTNGYYGIPEIIAAKNAIAGNEFASRYNLDYFENKAVPRYIIVTKNAKLNAPAQAALMAFFEGLKGQNHRTLYVPLPPDTPDSKVEFEMVPIETKIQDASFVNYDKINLRSILMAHRTPISKVGLPDGVSLAVARDANKTFKEEVCQPEQDILEKKLNKIIKQHTDIFYIALNDMTLTDEDTQSKIDERAIRNQWATPNEIRSRDGKPGLPDGDKVVDLKPQLAAEARAQQGQTRTRDQQRTNNATDSAGEGRASQGDGRTQG